MPISVWGAVAGVATLAGPVLGGLLVEHVGWQWIFLINIPIGVVSLLIALVALPNWQPRRGLRFDPLGTVLCAAGLLALVFGVQNGQHYHWGAVAGPVTIVHVLAAGVLLLAAFVYRQVTVRAREPLVPNELFRNPVFTYANLAHAAMGFAMTGMFLPLVLYLQTVLGLSALDSSALALPMALTAAAAAGLSGALWHRIGARNLIIAGFATLAAAVGMLVYQAEPDTAPATLIPGLAIAGLGIGFVFSPLTTAATTGMPPGLAGAASGVFNTSRQVGGVLGSAATGLVLQLGVAFAVPDAARQYSERLPVRYREEFVDRITEAANTASQFDSSRPPVPSELDPEVADIVRRIVTGVFHDGFTVAAKASLMLPIAVLLLGIVAATGIRTARLPGTGSAGHVPAGGADAGADRAERPHGP